MRTAPRPFVAVLVAWAVGIAGLGVLGGCEKRGVTPPTPSTGTTPGAGSGEAPAAAPPASAPSTP